MQANHSPLEKRGKPEQNTQSYKAYIHIVYEVKDAHVDAYTRIPLQKIAKEENIALGIVVQKREYVYI